MRKKIEMSDRKFNSFNLCQWRVGEEYRVLDRIDWNYIFYHPFILDGLIVTITLFERHLLTDRMIVKKVKKILYFHLISIGFFCGVYEL